MVWRPINKRGTTIRFFANWQLQQSQKDETTRDLQSIYQSGPRDQYHMCLKNPFLEVTLYNNIET